MRENAKLLIISLFFIFGFLLNFNPSYAWLSGWQYRRAINITNSLSTALTDYQVLITLDTATLISQGKMRSDCGDIRFTNSTDYLLSYWIESGCNTTTTRIWVKVPNIPASSSTTIYAYYGNSSATSLSNGDATFLFFDDFLGTSLNTSKWTVGVQNAYMSYSVGNGILTLSSSKSTTDNTWYSIRIQSVSNFPLPLAIRALTRFYAPSASESWGGLRGKFGYKYVALSNSQNVDGGGFAYFNNNYQAGVETSGGNNYKASSYSFGTWYVSETKITTTQIVGYLNDSLVGSVSYSLTSPQPISIALSMGDLSAGYNTSSQKIDFDWILVRKYASPEPTASIGAEELANQPPAITIYSPLNQTYFYSNNFVFNFSVSDDNKPEPYDATTNGLIGWWTFDEGSGTIAYDYSGYGNNGTLYNGTNICSNPPSSGCPTWVDGKIGKAISFDGVDDYVRVTYSSSMNIQQAFTFVAWVYPTAGEVDWRNVVGQLGNDDGIFLMSGNYFAGSVWVVNSNGSKTRLLVAGTTKQLNNWYFVVFTGISGVGYKLYVNGVLEKEANDTRPHQNLTSNFYIGGYGSRCFFAGSIDDVRIYNRALSDDEIKALYLNTAPKYIRAYLDDELIFQDTVYPNSTLITLKLNLTQAKAYNFTVYANDTQLSSQQSVIFTIKDFEIQQITYNTNVYETSQQTFNEVIRYNPDLVSNITATLIWNSTAYSTSQTQNSTHFILSSQFYIPLLQTNNTQVSFYFSNQINYLNDTTATVNSQTNQQNILLAYIPANLSVPKNVIEMDYIPVSFSPTYYSTNAELQAYVYFRNQTIQLTPRAYAYFTGSVDALNVTNYNETYPIYADLVISFNNQTITRSSNQTNITVYKVTLTDCSIFPTQTFQLIVRDEETTNTLTSLNYTFLRFDVTPLNNRISRTYIFENKQNICIYPAWASYNAKIYAVVRKDNYALTTHAPYTISVLSNQTQTLTLYMLPNVYATPITFTLPDQNYILYVERGYGANFVYIRSDTADFNKKVVVYLRPYDVYYKVKVFTPEQTLCFQSDQFKVASSTYEILSCQAGLVNYTITPMYQKIISGNCSTFDFGNYTRVLCSFVTLDNLDHDVNLTIYKLVEPFGEIVYYQNSTRASTGSFDVLLEKGYDYKVVMSAHSIFDYITFNIYSKLLQKSVEVFTLALILFVASAVVGFINPFAGLVMNVLILFGLSTTGVLTLQSGVIGALTLLIIVAIIFTREWR